MHIIEYKVVQDRKKKGVESFVKQAFKQMKEKNYANHHLVLQSRSNLKLYLNAFVFDVEHKNFGKVQGILADDSVVEPRVDEFTFEESGDNEQP